MVSIQDVYAAANRIAPHVHKTPIITSKYFDQITGRQIFFKCENFQKTGSFKARGAVNAVLHLKETKPDAPGVITHSSGNHGQALAFAGQMADVPCAVVTPNNTPESKCNAIRGYGATLHLSEPTAVSRIELCAEVAKRQGLEVISSHGHPDVIAGQGTIATEFHDQVKDLDAIFVSVAGGGMSTGVAIATHHIRPQCKVYVVEPEGKELGVRLESGDGTWPGGPGYINQTIAEGCRVREIGKYNWPMFSKLVEKDVFTINNDEIVEAMKLVWSRMKMVVETSAAMTVAAILSEHMEQLPAEIQRVGVVLCGGNVDLDHLPW